MRATIYYMHTQLQVEKKSSCAGLPCSYLYVCECMCGCIDQEKETGQPRTNMGQTLIKKMPVQCSVNQTKRR